MVVESRRLRDGGGKSFSKKNCEQRAGLGRDTAPFPKSSASYFRFARFNMFPLREPESLAQANFLAVAVAVVVA